MLLLIASISAVLNIVLFAGLPFLIYFKFQKWRHKRTLSECAKRAKLQLGNPRFLIHGAAVSVLAVALLMVWPPPLAPFLRHGSPQEAFRGLGLNAQSVLLALLYGVLKTGLPEELLFRGLIAGSLFRHLQPVWANLAQAAIFLIPHLFVLRVMPELWALIPVVFVASLFIGWLRSVSDSILGPILVHAALNVTICLSVAMRTAP